MMAAMTSAESWGRAIMEEGRFLMDVLGRVSCGWGGGERTEIYNGRSAVYDIGAFVCRESW